MRPAKFLLILFLFGLIAAFFALDLRQYLNLDYFQQKQAAIMAYYAAHQWQSMAGFFAAYVAVTALSLPVATVLSLAGGAVFGLFWATLLVSFASTLGATLAFLSARFLMRDAVQLRFGNKLAAVNAGVEKDGAFYLFSLRLIPLFPFFAVNLLMDLTPIRALTFAWVSQIGMLPGTLVYINAGTQLGKLESLRGIVSPELLLSFALLGIFPWLARSFVRWLQARQVLRRFAKPRRFDYNLLVIGAGSGGLVSAYIAAAVKAKVGLIEKHRMGGDCLNTGCVPSKALLRSAHFVGQARRAAELGLRGVSVDFQFREVMQRVQRIVREIEPHDSVERYSQLGVECITGAARLASPWEVEVDGKRLSSRAIILATGARPAIPPIAGIESTGYYTSDTIWELRELPPRFLVLGGGPVGCELAQAFLQLGSKVTLVHRGSRLLKREDAEFSELLLRRFERDGMDIRLNCAAVEFQPKTLYAKQQGDLVKIEFDAVLLTLGRKPNVENLGLEALGIAVNSDGFIETDEYLRTACPTVYACGDVAGPYQFTHTASHQAWYAAVNALFGGLRKFRVDYARIPWATFTAPEIARVGLNEQEAIARKIPYEVTVFPLDELDRAIADSAAEGMLKVLTTPGKDKILGATAAGAHAADWIGEFTLAMRHGLGLNAILSTIHIYPTMAETARYAAGSWKRAHKPEKLLRWVGRYHQWRRGNTIW
jgi:pyruvate/2-oxoglutarate dehydrogenase complex dihydrolipoamide dehydrogenase (E3) component/uncharacterized membrane protein YdjX (TVP38/TMEM64 family)